MSAVRSYGGGAATCSCATLPHNPSCPAAHFFAAEDSLDLHQETEDHPFFLLCPRCNSKFPQTEHTLNYDYSPTDGLTEQSELPLVCPRCGHSDKQTLPAIVGFNPFEDVAEEVAQHFTILCPASGCGWTGDRTDGVVDIWLEKAVVKGCVSMFYVPHNREYLKGEVYAEFTELSISCPDCSHSCGEDAD